MMTCLSDMVRNSLMRIIEDRSGPEDNVVYDVAVSIEHDVDGPYASLGVFLGLECPEVYPNFYSTCHATLGLQSACISEEGIEKELSRLWDHVQTARMAVLLALPDLPDPSVGGVFSD